MTADPMPWMEDDLNSETREQAEALADIMRSRHGVLAWAAKRDDGTWGVHATA